MGDEVGERGVEDGVVGVRGWGEGEDLGCVVGDAWFWGVGVEEGPWGWEDEEGEEA